MKCGKTIEQKYTKDVKRCNDVGRVMYNDSYVVFFFFFQAEDGIRDVRT